MGAGCHPFVILYVSNRHRPLYQHRGWLLTLHQLKTGQRRGRMKKRKKPDPIFSESGFKIVSFMSCILLPFQGASLAVMVRYYQKKRAGVKKKGGNCKEIIDGYYFFIDKQNNNCLYSTP